MNYIDIIILCGLIVVILLIILTLLIKTLLFEIKLKKKIYALGKGLTIEKTQDYIEFIDSEKIPLYNYYHKVITAGYELIKMSEVIDDNLKLKLRITILSKGVLVN